MREDEARAILAAQALEETDASGGLLAFAERRDAAAAAGAPLPPGTTSHEQERFLAARARWLLARAEKRFPAIAEWAPVLSGASAHGGTGPRRWKWVAAGIVLLTVALGYLSSELGPERKINILSYPLLGILAWSLFVYARELLSCCRGGKSAIPDLTGLVPLLEGTRRARDPVASEDGMAALSEEASRRFAARWARVVAPAWGARAKSWLHFLAFLLALSAVAGLYVKGLANEYRAVWESTFFEDGASLRPLLVAVLGPAAALTGREIPDASVLDAMRWRVGEAAAAGEPAAWWIHWYAATVAIFVLAPRALLALLWSWRARRAAVSLQPRSLGGDYFDEVLALASSAPLPVTVVPYAARPGETLRSQVADALEARRGCPIDLRWSEPVPFGEEESAAELALAEEPQAVSGISEVSGIPEGGEIAVLFSLSDTPEEETHLALVNGLLEAASTPVKSVIFDTTAFRSRFDEVTGSEEAEGAFEARMAAWRRLLPEPLELIALG